MIKASKGGRPREGGCDMRGYYTNGGYFGLVGGRYMLFASECDYYDFMERE